MMIGHKYILYERYNPHTYTPAEKPLSGSETYHQYHNNTTIPNPHTRQATGQIRDAFQPTAACKLISSSTITAHTNDSRIAMYVLPVNHGDADAR